MNILTKLRSLKVELSLVEGKLKVDAPKGAMTQEVLSEIKNNKDYLIEFIERITKNGKYSPISKSTKKEYYKLTSAQKRLYFLYQLDKSSTVYNLPQIIRLKGSLDKTRLEQAFEKLVIRHETLRTTFEMGGEEPTQKIDKTINFNIEYISADERQVAGEVKNFIRPFDLSQGPLIRVGLIDLSSEEYILMVDMHHIITDGVSQGVLINEFMSLYNGEDLADLTLQYKDYAEWQQSEEQQQEIASQRKFWLQEYSEDLSTMDLPLDFPRPKIKDTQGDVFGFELSKAESQELKNIAETEGSTMFMVLLSVFNVLLSRLSNQEDIVIGTPTSGRDHSDVDQMIGMFVNTLPLRNKVAGDLSFRELLHSVKSKTLSYFDNQSYPYEELITVLKVERDTSRNPLFDVMFSYQNYEEPELEMADLRLEAYSSGFTVSKFDLTLNAVELQGQFFMNFEYCTSLFKRESIERFAGYFRKIVSAVISDVDRRISAIDVMTETEKHQLLDVFNDTRVDFPQGKTVIDLFESQAKKTPKNIALVYHNEQVTYKDLRKRASQLAKYLNRNGISRGSVVGLMVDRSIDMIVGIIGILQAGCTYLPIDASNPKKRVLHILQESAASLLLTERHNAEKYRQYINTLDVYSVDIPDIGENILTKQISSSEVAYILYTSGSTGMPKGVIVSHRAIMNLIHCQKELFGINEKDKILQFSSINFDASVEQIWLALTSGSSLVLIDKDTITDPVKFSSYISSQGITHLHATPSFLTNVELGKKNKLKRIVSGGEEFKVQLASKFASYELYNEYGPTETTVTSTVNFLSKQEKKDSCKISIGRPINNTLIYILGSNLELLPRGVNGELYIAGSGLAQGYINNPSLTEERFVANPFKRGERMYKTGDLARWLPDGKIEYLGRLDNQVKIRGYRIELGEIENQLISKDQIKEAVVVVQEKGDDKYLVAYYVSKQQESEDKLRKYLSEKLPDYMIPTYYIQLDEIPLTINGKIDKKLLPPIEATLRDNYVAPSNEIEHKLVALWAEVLKLEETSISVNRSFFEMGGHSLKAAFLTNKIRKEMAVEVPLKEFFSHQNIASLSKFIEGSKKSDHFSIIKAKKQDYYALSSAQKRLYFLHEFDKNSLSYNLPQVLKLSGDLDKQQLKDAFNGLVARHESLRTSFEITNEEPLQKITEQITFEIESYLPQAEEEVEQLIVRFIRPFDLSQGPLIRVGLIDLSSEEYILMVDMHHIITDGVSQGVLINEFMSLYNGEDLADLTLQYKDYAEWQQSEEQQQEIASQRKFWLQEYSEDLSTMDLPLDFPRPKIKDTQGDVFGFEFSKAESQELKNIAETEGSTMFMVLLSVFNVLLSRLSNQEDIVIGTPTSGRDHSDVDQMIGMFVNTLPLRNKVAGDLSFRELLHSVKSKTLSYFDNQSYPYEELITVLKVERDTSRNPLFDVMFSYQNYEEPELEMADLRLEAYSSGFTVSKFDLTLNAVELQGQFFMNFEYCTSLFKRESIERFAGYFRKIVSAVISDVDRRISAIDVMTETEKHQLLNVFNDTKADYPREETIISLFKNQVSSSPDKIALVFESERISYVQLSDKVNVIANEINARLTGKHNKKIGLLFKPSIEMIASILGVLQAGCAYVPLSVDAPEERNRYILTDSNASLLLIHENLYDEQSVTNLFTEEEIVVVPNGCHFSKERYEYLKEEIAPDDIMSVIYTSGTTGNPKGVEVRHRGIVNYAMWRVLNYNFNLEDVTLQLFSYHFDGYGCNLYPCLLSGGTLILLADEKRMDGRHIVEIMLNEQVTNSLMTPGIYALILNEITIGDDLQNLRFIALGGEQSSTGLLQKSEDILPNVLICNEYGPTETSIASTHYNGLTSYNTNIIGQPISNTQVYILGKNSELLPRGAKGELCISGDGITKGYINNPSLTEERFVANPFKRGERMYKTGDLARWLPDGKIEYLGRLDNQVKIRGYRIELGEIENQLISKDQIKEAVVVVQEKGDDKYLVAYYVSKQQESEDKLRKYLSEKLPDYMIPTYYIQLDEIPLTINGKIDKKLLPPIEATLRDNYVAPSNEIEHKLVALWAEVLKLEETSISVNRSFFEMGGHSLKAAFLTNKIRKEMAVEVPLKEFFSHQNIASLSKFIEGSKKSDHFSIIKAKKQDYYALSSAQKRLYFLHEFDKNSLSYNLPQVLKLSGDLDKQQLKDAFNGLVARHESLRTSFEITNEEPLQKITEQITFEIESYLPQAEEEVEQLIVRFIRPFDLSQGPLIRVGLIDLSSEEYILMVDMHHIITDGVSQGVLINEFMSLYNGEDLADLTLQYKDYAEWQQSEEQQQEIASQRKFWLQEYSEDLSTMDLPLDFPRPKIKDTQGDVFGFEFSKAESQELKNIAETEGSTMFMVLLSVFNVLLSRLSNQEDIVIGTPTSGRDHSDVDQMIGMFVNTLPLRNKVAGDLSFRELLHSVKSKTLSYFDNQSYPYEELITVLKVERDTSRNPLFDVMFSYQNYEEPELEMADLRLEAYSSGFTVSKFDLTLNAVELQGQFFMNFEYCTSLFKRESIERFAGYFRKIVSAVISDVDRRISAIDVMTETEKHQLLNVFNSTRVDFLQDKTVIDLFEERVKKDGGRIAIVFKNEYLTFDVLNNKINQLSNYLIKSKGVEIEDVVGLYFDRTPSMIVALLAILKTGAVYVPLDPEYPNERINKIITDAQIKLIVTDLNNDLSVVSDCIDIINYNTVGEEISRESETNPDTEVSKENSAYIIYTSGSTGLPKGILIRHCSLLDYCLTFVDHFSVTKEDRVIQQSSLSFDTAVEEIFPAIISGASVVIMPNSGRDIPYMVESIAKKQATILSTTPMVLSEINQHSNEVRSLRTIISGGDLLLPEHINNLLKNYKVYNSYGPSESTVCITFNQITKLGSASYIGRPIRNREVFILNKNGDMCPIMVKGELCVSGIGLAKEYVNNEKLTNERFVANPFIPGVRMYKTGDLARWQPDGNIEYLGRIDNQVKIRGYRIELGEIENVLVGHHQIKGAVVTVQEKLDNKYLVAYYVSDEAELENTLYNYLQEKLPNYMVPSYYIQLDEIPLTINGKIDKKLLPSIEPTLSDNYVAPSNEIEYKLVALWAEVLKLDEASISVSRSFFEMGGHSLNATKLLVFIRKKFDVEISLLDIFTSPTIKAVSQKIYISQDKVRENDDLLTLLKQDLNSDKNLFFVHDGSGDVQAYLELTSSIRNYNCWGIRSDTLRYSGPLNIDISELADINIKRFKQVQPSGPYHLIGWSFGGIIAYEMTRLLELSGEKVELLTLIDCEFNKGFYGMGLVNAKFSIENEKSLLSSIINEKFFELSNIDEIEALWNCALDLIKNDVNAKADIKRMIPQEISALISNFDDLDIEDLIIHFNTVRTMLNVIECYKIDATLESNIHYIKASETQLDATELVGLSNNNIEVSEVHGDHFSILTSPLVVELAKTIGKLTDKEK